MQSADCVPCSLQTAYLAPCSLQTAQVLRLHATYIYIYIYILVTIIPYSSFLLIGAVSNRSAGLLTCTCTHARTHADTVYAHYTGITSTSIVFYRQPEWSKVVLSSQLVSRVGCIWVEKIIAQSLLNAQSLINAQVGG